MTLMLALARITEGTKGTQLYMAKYSYTSPKPSTTSTWNVYLIYFTAYDISHSIVAMEIAYQTGIRNIEDRIDGCQTRIMSCDRTIRGPTSIVDSAKKETIRTCCGE